MSSEIPTTKYTNPDLFKRDTGMTPEEFDAHQAQIEAFGGQFEPDDNDSLIREADKRMDDMVNTVLEATPSVLARRAEETRRAAAREVLTDGMETNEGKE